MTERTQYPHQDGDFTVLGPEIFTDPRADVICWKGENYVRQTERDGAYRERAHLVAWLAAMHESVIAPAPDVDEPGWQIVYVYAGGWQMSWHVHPRDAQLFKGVERVAADHPRAQWDQHSTEQKYNRIRNHTRVIRFNERVKAPKAAPIQGSGYSAAQLLGADTDD